MDVVISTAAVPATRIVLGQLLVSDSVGAYAVHNGLHDDFYISLVMISGAGNEVVRDHALLAWQPKSSRILTSMVPLFYCRCLYSTSTSKPPGNIH